MLEENNDTITLEVLFKNYGYEVTGLTEKEKIKLLKDIIFKIKIEKDYEELKFSKLPEPKTTNDISEYVSKINNLDCDYKNAIEYIACVKKVYKENRKLNKKAKRMIKR